MTVEIASGYLAQALYASLFRVICGFAIAVAVGVALGATMARIRLVSDLSVRSSNSCDDLAAGTLPARHSVVRYPRRGEDLHHRLGGIALYWPGWGCLREPADRLSGP